MRALTYPVPVPADPRRPDAAPRVSAIGNRMVPCRPCQLWHEIPTAGRISRVTCRCGRTVWERRHIDLTSSAGPVLLGHVECDYGHAVRRPWCAGCREAS